MPRNYNEIDISFYGTEKIIDFDVIPQSDNNENLGNLIQWKETEEDGGTSIYRKQIGSEGWELIVTLEDGIYHYMDRNPPIEGAYDYQLYRILEGDFMLGSPDIVGGVDFQVTAGHESGVQDALNRIRTQKTDWRSHPKLGANLELLEGQPNTRETGDQGVEQIREALNYDGRFSDSDITVRAVPTSIEKIEFYTIIDSDDNEPIIIRDIANL